MASTATRPGRRPAIDINQIQRHRTAIGRVDVSRPLRLTLEAGLLSKGRSFFDYGCGRGHDVKHLRHAGHDASGWDPHHRPNADRLEADVVNLGYVVNVIEDPQERAEALQKAWALTRATLVVSARTSHEVRQLVDGGQDFTDGKLTSAATFQKFYGQAELREWIDTVLPEDATAGVPAAPGVFFVFRDPLERERFIESRYRRRRAAPRARRSDALFEEHAASLEPLMEFVTQRGRLPMGTEVTEFVGAAEAFGSLKRAMQLVRRVTGVEVWEQHAEQRREELLLWLALSRFNDAARPGTSTRASRRIGRPSLAELPEDLRHDVKHFFRSHKAACEAGDQLLFSTGDADMVEEAVKATEVGKKLPQAIYIHADALDRLPLILRVREGCARSYVGDVDGCTLIKLDRIEPKVSYLAYPGFDKQAHPALSWSMRVAMGWCDIKTRDFSGSKNPPVLHRKETFLTEDDPRFEKFAALTAREEKAGLLDETSRIGTRDGWAARLEDAGFRVAGHRLLRVKRDAPEG